MSAPEPTLTPSDTAMAEPAARIPLWATLGLPVAVFIITCVAFLPAVKNGFVSLDDHKNFQLNYNYRGLGPENIKWAWTTFHNGAYQPLSWMLFGAQYVAWGLDPTGYHVVSVLLQAVNGMLFFWVAARLLALAMPDAARDHPIALRLSSGLAALLFAVHPLRTEAVAWLSTQPYLPVGMFYLLSVLAYLRACRDEPTRTARPSWLAVSCVCYACSILSKGVGVGLVVVLILLDVYPLRRLWPGRVGGGPGATAWRVLLEKVPFFLLGIGSALLALHSKVEAMVPVGTYDIPHRIAQAAWGFMFYLHKTVLPIGLSPWYQFPKDFGVFEARFIISGVLVVGLTIGSLVVWLRWPAATVLWLYYVIVLLPLSHLVKLGRQAAADRYSYVACMGWAILAGAGLLAAWQASASGRMQRSTFKVVAAASVMACVLLAGLSWRQSQVWRDGLSLWSRAAEVSPNTFTPNNNLAQELQGRGDMAGALRHLKKAIELDPDSVTARVNMALLIARVKGPQQAIELLEEAIELDPEQPLAYSNLAGIYLSVGQLDKGIASCERAIALRPRLDGARRNLAGALIKKGRYDEAIEQCREVLKIIPDSADAHGLWGMALMGKGDSGAAAAQLRRAIELDPCQATARGNLAKILANQERFGEALALLRAGVSEDLPRREPRAMAALAQFLLTCPDKGLRNPREALTWARSASEAMHGLRIDYLELMATALAANLRIDEAIAVARRAVELAKKGNQPNAAKRINQRIRSFEQLRGIR
jgi:protein O-mannosyl-transferase